MQSRFIFRQDEQQGVAVVVRGIILHHWRRRQPVSGCCGRRHCRWMGAPRWCMTAPCSSSKRCRRSSSSTRCEGGRSRLGDQGVGGVAITALVASQSRHSSSFTTSLAFASSIASVTAIGGTNVERVAHARTTAPRHQQQQHEQQQGDDWFSSITAWHQCRTSGTRKENQRCYDISNSNTNSNKAKTDSAASRWLTMVVVVVSSLKRFVFEWGADRFVREIFTFARFSENHVFNALLALCTEVLRDCGVLATVFLAVKLRFWLCFFSALRKQACWFLFAKTSAFLYGLSVELFFDPFTVLCEKAEHLSRSVCTRKRSIASWLAESLTFFNLFSAPFNLFSALCEKADHFISFPLTETCVFVPACKETCVCLLTDSWTFFKSVHCSVRDSRTFVTIVCTRKSTFASWIAYWLRVELFQSVHCPVRESRIFVTMASHAQKPFVSWIAQCLTFFNLFSALCEKAKHVSCFLIDSEFNILHSVHWSVRATQFLRWQMKIVLSVKTAIGIDVEGQCQWPVKLSWSCAAKESSKNSTDITIPAWADELCSEMENGLQSA